jgi:starch-binding outer membrane protein, SusD/RagB family
VTMHKLQMLTRVARRTLRTGHRQGAVLLLAATAACSTDRILKADRPDQIDPARLSTDLQGARALAAGAVGDFTVAINGGSGGGAGNGQIMASGYLSDEFRFGGTPPELREMDLRNVRAANGAWLQTYLDLHRARESAQRAAGALRAVTASDPGIAEMYALQGALLVMQGENYCSGAPVSTTQPTLTYGPPLTTAQIFALAITRLDSSLGSTGISANVRSLASTLKGRAQLGAGQFAAAATTVSAVPTSYSYQVSHGLATARQQSFTWSYMYNTQALLVSDREGTNGLNFATAGDPRVPIDGDGAPSSFDLVTPRYYFRNYNRQNHTVTVASGVEARLIEAEAALQAGNTATFIQKLNEARTPWSGLAPLTDPGTPTARVDLLFRERAFAMFGTSHRVGDLRRLTRQYGRPAESVWPTGAYHKDNLQRGTDTNIIVPLSEANNPNFTGCLNRNP